MRAENFDYDKIVNICLGTCNEDLESAISYHYPEMDVDDLTLEDHDLIDNEMFLCDACGWWCEASELEEEFCTDCSNEEDEEDE